MTSPPKASHSAPKRGSYEWCDGCQAAHVFWWTPIYRCGNCSRPYYVGPPIMLSAPIVRDPEDVASFPS